MMVAHLTDLVAVQQLDDNKALKNTTLSQLMLSLVAAQPV